MLTHNDLPEAPVRLTVTGAEGHQHTLAIAREIGGDVELTCSCAMFSRESWCRHAVDVLCMRLRALGVVDDELDFALERVVLGTKAEDVSHELDRALIAYERALARFDTSRSASLETDVLETMGALARDLADAAAGLADAAMRFRRALASQADRSVP
ncbi:MAG: SWIM zinc finger family protein [Salinarimonas sp.]